MDAAEAAYVEPDFFTEHAEERWVERVGDTLDTETRRETCLTKSYVAKGIADMQVK